MDGKEKTDAQILLFINALQRAILERRIRKTDVYAKQINIIQESMVTLYNKMGATSTITLDKKMKEDLLRIAGTQKQRLSVAYMKRYVGLQGKHITKEKAGQLAKLIVAAISKGNIPAGDPYRQRLNRIHDSLKHFMLNAKPKETLQIHEAALNGIHQALDGCCEVCDHAETESKRKGRYQHELSGIESPQLVSHAPDEHTIMNSMDFAAMKFETLGFMGKWKEFIGDPSPGFTAMVSGSPKFGKSYLCAEFAGYLARHHGRTLFVGEEEKFSKTLQEKLEAVKHPYLDVTGTLPDDLSPYEFIILDSVSRMKLSPEDQRALEARYPGKSFIKVYQVTKDGKFRGTNEAEHDVDVVIQVPEKGKAIQFGRFNQGGEMDIFDKPIATQTN